MKTSLKLVLAGLVLLTQGFGQEPKQALAKQVATPESRKKPSSQARRKLRLQCVQPKALPPLNPSLGEIARQARAAHAAAPKAQEVADTDNVQQKDTENVQQKDSASAKRRRQRGAKIAAGPLLRPSRLQHQTLPIIRSPSLHAVLRIPGALQLADKNNLSDVIRIMGSDVRDDRKPRLPVFSHPPFRRLFPIRP